MATFRFAAGQKSISADDLVVFAEIVYKLQNAFKSREGKQKKTRLPGSRSQDLPTPTQPLIDSQSALIP